MNDISECDEIRLNALLDGELDADERAALTERMASEPALREAYWQRALTRDLVAHAWDDLEPAATPEPPRDGPSRAGASRGRRPVVAAAAALLLVAAGFLAGQLTPLAPAGGGGMVAAEEERRDQVVVHVMDAAPDRQRAALDRVAELLEQGNERVELVAHSRGLDLVRADRTAEGERIRALLEGHPALRVYACGNTIARLQRDGEEVELLPGARRASSAVDHIVDRLQAGWRYIKV